MSITDHDHITKQVSYELYFNLSMFFFLFFLLFIEL